jgi:thioredoxin reductase (NADPH)
MFEGFNAGGLIPGGQLMFTTEVENYPGFPEGMTGPSDDEGLPRPGREIRHTLYPRRRAAGRFLAASLRGQERPTASSAPTRSSSPPAPRQLAGPRERKASRRKSGGGVSACAVCDGALPMYRGQELVVVGGGDSAIEEASYLTKFASKVHMIHRRASLPRQPGDAGRASLSFRKRASLKSSGTQRDRRARRGRRSAASCCEEQDRREARIRVQGLFLAIGHTPNTESLRRLTSNSRKTSTSSSSKPGTTYTNVEGVFAAGDVADHVYRQAVTAAGTGCMAALDAERWLAAQGID